MGGRRRSQRIFFFAVTHFWRSSAGIRVNAPPAVSPAHGFSSDKKKKKIKEQNEINRKKNPRTIKGEKRGEGETRCRVQTFGSTGYCGFVPRALTASAVFPRARIT